MNTESKTKTRACKKAHAKPRWVKVSGKNFLHGGEGLKADTYFETMAEAGWVRITSIGNENLYFEFRTDEGEILLGYCKCL